MVYMDGKKMSKSLGNLVFVDKLRETYDPRAIRLAIIEHHYRYDWSWDDDLMPRSVARLDAWMKAVGGLSSDVLDDVRAALDDDLDTARAVALLDEAAASGIDVSAGASLLGVEL
jgi:L-cysteine:1D-myo-inositol 2-amino-2-deoxy-alpha-D-glucopyranoside ligase